MATIFLGEFGAPSGSYVIDLRGRNNLTLRKLQQIIDDFHKMYHAEPIVRIDHPILCGPEDT